MERWTGKRWVCDDGEAGIAFVGLRLLVDPHGAEYNVSAAISARCNCERYECPGKIAVRRAVKRFGTCSGYDFEQQ